MWQEILGWVYFCGLVIFFLFCGKEFLRLGHVGFSRWELIFAIFKKCSTFPASRDLSRRGNWKWEEKWETSASDRALIIFSFLLSTCNQDSIEIYFFKHTVSKDIFTQKMINVCQGMNSRLLQIYRYNWAKNSVKDRKQIKFIELLFRTLQTLLFNQQFVIRLKSFNEIIYTKNHNTFDFNHSMHYCCNFVIKISLHGDTVRIVCF